MSEPTAHATTHPVTGGTEVDVTITIPTPAAEVHPDTPVVPAATPEAQPTPAGVFVDGGAGDVLVVTPAPATAPEPTPPTPSGHPGDTPTTTAGEAGTATVIRPDDPNATPVPAQDLDPSTPVIPADTPKEVRPDPTENDVTVLFGDDPDAQKYAAGLLDKLKAHGMKVVWA